MKMSRTLLSGRRLISCRYSGSSSFILSLYFFILLYSLGDFPVTFLNASLM